MFTARTTARTIAPVLLAAAALAAGSTMLHAQGTPNQYGNTLKHAPVPTTAAITTADLKTRLYIFADDSMQGRQFGREGNMRGTNYIARELKRLGIQPMGDNGTYFQNLPITVRKYTDRSTLAIDGRPLKWNRDFVAVAGRGGAPPRQFTSAQVIFGGVAGDSVRTITPEQAAGKLVILYPAPAPLPSFQPPPQRGAGPGAANAPGRAGAPGGGNAASQQPAVKFANAAAIATIDLQTLTMSQRAFLNNPTGSLDRAPAANAAAPTPGVPTLRITTDAATLLLGANVAQTPPGTTGGTVTANLDFVQESHPEYGRNVIAVIPGSDPKLKGQYVAIGAHNDHNGFTATPIDHDSAYVAQRAALARSFVGTEAIRTLTPIEQAEARMSLNLDSLRKVRPVRLDSIQNGADDDGSGSMAVLEIAEAVSKMAVKPKRSIIFVWHTGEEAGLLGSAYFTQHPTVPKDSIVAQINIDMIGRGRSEDIPGGGPDYLGVVGANMLSADLGAAVEAVNKKQSKPLKLDYRFDQDVTATLGGAYNNIYGRSDHFNYAKLGIPIAFFFTGLHADYHRNTDEPQYIDYPHYSRITNYVKDLLVDVANNPKRPVVTKPVS
jgi:hypothetical protein